VWIGKLQNSRNNSYLKIIIETNKTHKKLQHIITTKVYCMLTQYDGIQIVNIDKLSIGSNLTKKDIETVKVLSSQDLLFCDGVEVLGSSFVLGLTQSTN